MNARQRRAARRAYEPPYLPMAAIAHDAGLGYVLAGDVVFLPWFYAAAEMERA